MEADLPSSSIRALGHRMEALRNMADKYVTTMALQANAEATSTQANVSSPAKENKHGPSAATPKAKTWATRYPIHTPRLPTIS